MGRPNRSRWLLEAARGACFACALGACSEDKPGAKGQILLAVQTDMSIPEDISAIRVVVLKGGALKFDQKYEVGEDKEQIPATLGLVASDDSENHVEVRVLGYQRTRVRTLSRVVTIIPLDRVATLHVPVQWLCDGQVVATEGVAESFDSTCEDVNQACVAGECKDVEIDPTTLPDYELADVQGGAEDPTLGRCLDTAPCFDAGRDVVPDSDCTLSVDSDEEPRLNVGLLLPAGAGGICSLDTDQCYVPLDRDAVYGWQVASSAPSAGTVTVQLPPAVCSELASGDLAGVRVTAACATKTAQNPTCGPWTQVGVNNDDNGPQ